MKKFDFDGISGVFYEQNIYSDALPLIKYGEQKITTGEMKLKLDHIIEYISHVVKGYSIIDSRAEQYGTALTVFKFIRHIFNQSNTRKARPSKADVKIAMDVVAEIAIAEETNDTIKNAIKTVNILAQLSLGSD